MIDFNKIFLTRLCDGVASVQIGEINFNIRVWKHQLSQINEFLLNAREDIIFSECIYDVDNHYRDFVIRKTLCGSVFTFGESSNDGMTGTSYNIEVTHNQCKTFLLNLINKLTYEK